MVGGGWAGRAPRDETDKLLDWDWKEPMNDQQRRAKIIEDESALARRESAPKSE
jgi:hypothetical protein